MKKLLFNFKPILLGLLVVTGCTDLEPVERDSIVIENAGGPGAGGDPTELLKTAYRDLGAYTDQANIYSLFEHPTDEMIPPTRGVDWGDNGVWRTLHTHNWDATHSWILGAWNQLNERVFKAGQIIEAASATAVQKAEAKFLRALHMWHIMDLWGKVPFRGVNDGVDVLPTVKTRTEAFDFIVKDLTEALPNLPDLGPASTNPRGSKAAANALLARLYLNRAVYKQPLESAAGPYTFDNADMDKVIQYADAVAASGYSLNPDYFNNFTSTAANEVILTSPEGTPQNRYFMTLHYSQTPSGWNGFTTLAEFYDKFGPNDKRKGAYNPDVKKEFSWLAKGFLIGQQQGPKKNDKGEYIKTDKGDFIIEDVIDSRTTLPLKFTRDITLAGAATEKGIRVIKYHPGDQGQYIILRYADVYLMKVEALLRKGSASEATTLINNLRVLRGAGALPGTATLTDIYDERGRELYWEGIRRVDQVRFGTFTGTWTEKTVTEAKRVIYPIPQQAIDSNPNLTQNPGY